MMEVPGYKVIRTIGRGGMATVHLAVQESLGRNVVLKTLNTSQHESADFVERFMNEGRMVASLRHPHIITIFDIGSADELVYIAMEYVEGGDLKSRIHNGISAEQALEIVLCVASALDYAHGHGIIHRDVKPANILFRGDGTPLLSDFGIAKQVAADTELTSTGTILGSPFYMSPEQSEGFVVDGRTDIYSLGVIFHEMLTGERPYTGDSAIKVIMQHIQSPMPKLPRSLGTFQPLLERMMAKDRGQRLRDAEAVINEVHPYLDAYRNASGVTTNTDIGSSTIRMEAPRVPRRSRLPALVLLVGVLAVMLAGGAYYVYLETRPSSTLFARSAPGDTQLSSSPDTVALAAPPDPVPADGGEAGTVDKRDVIQALEWLARSSLRDDRLTQPPADNAYYYYSRLLALEPTNEAARKGFQDIAERFVVLAEQEFSRNAYGQAQAYIALGLQVDPQNKALISLRSFIENRKKSLLETVVDLFR